MDAPNGEKKCISRRRNYSDRAALSVQLPIRRGRRILYIANVTRRLLLNVTHQRAPIIIGRLEFLSQIKYMSLDARLDTDLCLLQFNSKFRIILNALYMDWMSIGLCLYV